MITRPYTLDDAAVVAELANQIGAHDGGQDRTTADALAETIAAVVRDLPSDTRLEFAPDGTLIGYALVPSPPAGGATVNLFGGVRPGWRARGLGRQLLGWQLDRAQAIHYATAPSTEWEALATIPEPATDAARLFRRFGLAPARYGLKMVAVPTSDPVAPLPESPRVQAYRPGHIAALHAAHTEAFTGLFGFQARQLAQWQALTVGSASFRPELSWLCFAGDVLVGYVLTYDSAQPQVVYVGQVGVLPGWRRQGLAAAMLSQQLTSAYRAGASAVELHVDAASPTGAVGVYERVGFVVKARVVGCTVALPARTPA